VTIDRRTTGVLVVSNLLGGVGVASGVAVGGLLVEELGGTAVAGVGQAASVLGAAVAAVPLATLAVRRGRRWSLATGYGVALLGALLVIVGAVAGALVVLMVGLGLFGVAQAVNLQSRYAAAEGASAQSRGRAMALVLWATTIGAVAGPNLTATGARAGDGLGLPALAGPYLFSLVAFTVAGMVIAVLYRAPATVPATPGSGPAVVEPGEAPLGAVAALRWAARHPVPRFAVVLTAVAHSAMVMVMVMTPLHMQHRGMSLELVGLVISLHVLGMYALSPVFGWVSDRFGPLRLALAGLVLLALAVALGFVAALVGEDSRATAAALVVLGTGWSASVIAASALLAAVPSDRVRVPLQGATDAGMSYAGAVAAALAGPILALGGFRAVNVAAAILLTPAGVLMAGALRSLPTGAEPRSPVVTG
jgi:MFS family permease